MYLFWLLLLDGLLLLFNRINALIFLPSLFIFFFEKNWFILLFFFGNINSFCLYNIYKNEHTFRGYYNIVYKLDRAKDRCIIIIYGAVSQHYKYIYFTASLFLDRVFMEIVYLFMSKYFIAIIVHESSAKTPDIHTGSIRMKKKEEDKKKLLFHLFLHATSLPFSMAMALILSLLYGCILHLYHFLWDQIVL